MNGLDNNIYSIGRGPSKLTVTAPDLSAASGQAVVISGTVTDISAGTKQNQQAADFPNGVPVASDSIMKDWMGYVYQQKALPSNFKGVDVTINVVDANGNFRTIGTATTDYTGAYNLVWQPDISRQIQRHRNICRNQQLLAIISNSRIQRNGRTPNNSASTNCSTINV